MWLNEVLINCLITKCAHISVVKKVESIYHNHNCHLFFSRSASLFSSHIFVYEFSLSFSLWGGLKAKHTCIFYAFHLAAVSLTAHPLSCSETPWQHFRGRLSLPSLWPVSILHIHTHSHTVTFYPSFVTAVCLCMLTTCLFASLSFSSDPFFLSFPSQGDRRRAFWRHCSQRVLQWGRCQVNAISRSDTETIPSQTL